MEDLSNDRALNGCPKTEARLGLRLRGKLVRALVSSKSGPGLRQRTLEWLEDLDPEIAILQDKLTPDAPS
jgi:hypothetical protein